MLRLLKNRQAQNTVEYALLIVIIIGVFSAMQIYLKRGMQARLKAGTDGIPDLVLSQSGDTSLGTKLFGTQTQYEPYYIRKGDYNFTTTSSEGAEEAALTDRGGSRDLTGATSSRAGSQTIIGAEEDTQ